MKTERNILIAFVLNFIFSIFELFGGIFTKSVAIISDSIHDLGDSLSIGISYILEKKSKKKADEYYTYGYKRYSVLGAIVTNTVLITGAILVIYNSINRIINPIKINYNGMIIFAIIGFIVNLIAAYYTKGGKTLNQKAVNLHMFEDVFGWLIVLIGAIIMKFTNLSIIDPLMSIGVALYIVSHTSKNFKTIINLFLMKTPDNLSLDEIKKEILKIKGVEDIKELHIWSLDGIDNYAITHIIINNDDKIKDIIRKVLKKYNINHITIETDNKK